MSKRLVTSRLLRAWFSTAKKGEKKLSQETMKIIHATAPVMKEHGLTITRTFYPLLFSRYPQLLNIFNQTNQRDTRQAQSLAGAVYAFAQNIESLGSIEAAVNRIAHKHAALKIEAPMYDMVGECLLEATKQVLGPAATPEIMRAWTEGYEFLAQIFINKEADLTKKSTDSAWGGWRPFIVKKKIKETSNVTSFYLEPESGKIGTFLPGQYLTIKIAVPGQNEIRRHYSISCAPNESYFRISVKREGNPDQGLSSTYLHDYVKEKDTVDLGAPFGDFYLEPQHLKGSDPLILVSGGIGCTPLVSMLEEIVKKNVKAPVYWFHGCLNGTSHVLRREIEKLVEGRKNIQTHIAYDKPFPFDRSGVDYNSTGRLDAHKVKGALSGSLDGHFYFCGPPGFMLNLHSSLNKWDVPDSRIHYEYFGPWQE